MNTALWIAQGLLAALFLMAGMMKLTQPREKLLENMEWAEDFGVGAVKTIGLLELLGAIGLVLPGVTGIAPVLVPLAAVGLVLVMVGASVVHARRSETRMVLRNIVLLAIAAFVAWGRFGNYPL